jgi:serine/threonine protein kinase
MWCFAIRAGVPDDADLVFVTNEHARRCVLRQRLSETHSLAHLFAEHDEGVRLLMRPQVLLQLPIWVYAVPSRWWNVTCSREVAVVANARLQLRELLRRMLEFNPARRITAAEALALPVFADMVDEDGEPTCNNHVDFGFLEQLRRDPRRLLYEQVRCC